MKACRADHQRWCSEFMPGGPRAVHCMLEHKADLQPSCLKAVKLLNALQACGPDLLRYCKGIQPGPDAMTCLEHRMDELRPACQRVVKDEPPSIRQGGPAGPYSPGMRQDGEGAPQPEPGGGPSQRETGDAQISRPLVQLWYVCAYLTNSLARHTCMRTQTLNGARAGQKPLSAATELGSST